LLRVREKLEAFGRRLDGVIIEDCGWERCVELYDSPKTLFFADPPYIGGAQKTYESWTLSDMQKLAERLQAVQGNWLLTVNDSPELRALFAFADVTPISRPRGIKSGESYGELVVRKRLSTLNSQPLN
jgi:DNA adenine methylase